MRFHVRTYTGSVEAIMLTAAILGSNALWTSRPAAAPSSLCGDWTFVHSPSPARSAVYDADAVSQDDIWSVGQADNAAHTLAIHWNGTSWSQVVTPSPSGTYNDLSGVAAIASDNVWAVGVYNPPGGASQTLVEHWDGTDWGIVASPFITGGSIFFAASALTASEIWAAGSRAVGAPGPDEGPLIARWDGSSWILMDTPYIGNRINRLFGVDARASSDVWAVGTWKNIGSPFHILIMHWDGNAWTIHTLPDPGQNDELLGVAAIAANDAWAVGDRYDPVEGPQPLIMHWNGSAWSQYSLPVFGGGFITLSAVEAVSASDIWAAGTDATDSGIPRPLLMHWDGASWSVVAAGPTDGDSEDFRGLAEVSSCDVWAVGSYFNGTTSTILTQRLQPGSAGVASNEIPGAGSISRLTASPNPSQSGITISFDLLLSGDLRAEVFDVRGRRVRSLEDRTASAGHIRLDWNRIDDRGERAPSGLYFVRVSAAGQDRIARVVLR